jgi:hypothetical protein
VTYRPRLEQSVLRQMPGLPDDVFDLLVGTLARICDHPCGRLFRLPTGKAARAAWRGSADPWMPGQGPRHKTAYERFRPRMIGGAMRSEQTLLPSVTSRRLSDYRGSSINSPLSTLSMLSRERATVRPHRKRERFRFPGRIDPAIRAVISYELSIKAPEREFWEDSQNMRYPVFLVISCDHYL